MKVYVITEGDYSSYHIIGVTTDKKTAETYCNLHTNKHNFFVPRVEEFDTDFLSYCANPDYKCYRVTATNGVFRAEEDGFGFECPEEVGVVNAWKYKNGAHQASMYCFAKSVEQAIKIAQDKMAQYKAAKASII